MNYIKIAFIIFTTSFIPFNVILAQSDNDKANKKLNVSSEAEDEIEILNKEIKNLKTQLEEIQKKSDEGWSQAWSESTRAADAEKKINKDIIPDDPPFPDDTKNNNLQSQINNLNQKIDSLKRKIGQQAIKIATLEQENTNLKGRLQSIKNSLDRAIADLATAQSETQRLQDIVNCTDDFFNQRIAARTQARQKIEEANELVRFLYLQSDEKMEDYEKRNRVNVAFEIFMDYGGGSNSTTCYGRPLSYEDDYLKASEHLMLVDLLAANRYNVAEQLGDDISGRVNKMNNLLLKNLGAAYENGSYDERSDATAVSEKVGFLIVSEKKGTDGMDASEVLTKIRDIRIAFDGENYASAVSIYNKYERFFTIEDVKKEVDLIANAQYAMGTILSWNLASIADYRGLYINGTWLDNNIRDRLEVGRRLLKNEVVENRYLYNDDLKKEAILALRKQYQSKGSKRLVSPTE